jgi:2-polyprenyl-3-methyl-5-hydroxy-6-metoxy-1,4-benzoquinol methylase
MNKNEYKKMAELEKEYWWHQGRLYLIDELINKHHPNKTNRKILEVGCGTGETTRHLKKHGEVIGIDVSDEAIKYGKQNGIEDIYSSDIVNIQNNKNLKDKKFDLIFALDVLEHIQEDKTAMKNIYGMLNTDGLFITTVPAHKFLWSEHDESLHHKRRYHMYEITKKLEDSNFTISDKSYFIFFLFPIVFAYRLWGNITGKSAYPKTSYVILPKTLNNLFINLLKIEAKMIKYFRLPIGVTIVVVAKKL